MKKWYKIFCPNNFIVFCNLIFIILSLTYLIVFDKFNTPISYVLYLVMSYALITICVKIFKLLNNIFYKIVEHNKYLKKYVGDPKLRNRISLFCSLLLNVIYVVFKLISGICYKSLWFISFAIYYLILVIMRARIAKEEMSKNTTLKDEYLKYRKTGINLLFMNIFLTIIILVIVNQKIMITYDIVIAIAIAVYTFYLMISSIINLIKYRKYKSPLISSAKVVNVITSLISMLSLEVTMLSTFGADEIEFNEIMIMATGGGISIIIIIISLFMIIKSTEWINKNV